MIHVVVALTLLGITHLLSFLTMTEQKYSVRKTAFIYSMFCAMFVCLAVLSYVLFQNSFACYAVGFISTIIMSFFVFLYASADPTCKKIFLFISYANVFCILGCISNLLCGILLKSSPEIVVYYARNILRTVLFIPTTVIYIHFLRPSVRAVPGKRRKTWCAISVASSLFLIIFSLFLIIFHVEYGHIDRYIPFFVITVLIYGAVLWIIFNTIRSMIEESNTELVNQNVAYLQGQLKTAKENELAAKTVRHDFRHHNQNVVSMLQKGEVQEAISYLEQYNDSLNGSNPNDFCPNITVNAILSSFYTRAHQSGISISIAADTKENVLIADMDFVAILSNLLENAINGCLECNSAGEIALNIRTVSDKIVILCTNPCKPGIVIENSMIKNRGIGIASMLSAIRKYDGDIRYDIDQETLKVCIILNS